jgi:hypothetical protein
MARRAFKPVTVARQGGRETFDPFRLFQGKEADEHAADL